MEKIERGSARTSLEVMVRIAEPLERSPQEQIQHSKGIEHSMPPPGREVLSTNPVLEFPFQNVDHLVGVKYEKVETMRIHRTFTKHEAKSAEEVVGTALWNHSRLAI